MTTTELPTIRLEPLDWLRALSADERYDYLDDVDLQVDLLLDPVDEAADVEWERAIDTGDAETARATVEAVVAERRRVYAHADDVRAMQPGWHRHSQTGHVCLSRSRWLVALLTDPPMLAYWALRVFGVLSLVALFVADPAAWWPLVFIVPAGLAGAYLFARRVRFAVRPDVSEARAATLPDDAPLSLVVSAMILTDMELRSRRPRSLDRFLSPEVYRRGSQVAARLQATAEVHGPRFGLDPVAMVEVVADCERGKGWHYVDDLDHVVAKLQAVEPRREYDGCPECGHVFEVDPAAPGCPVCRDEGQ